MRQPGTVTVMPAGLSVIKGPRSASPPEVIASSHHQDRCHLILRLAVQLGRPPPCTVERPASSEEPVAAICMSR